MIYMRDGLPLEKPGPKTEHAKLSSHSRSRQSRSGRVWALANDRSLHAEGADKDRQASWSSPPRKS